MIDSNEMESFFGALSTWKGERRLNVERQSQVQRAGCVDEESTGTLRNIHESTNMKPYSGLVMHGAFVVQLLKAGPDVGSQMEGSVEEVDTGKQSQFRSEEELLRFMRERFTETVELAKKGRNR